MDPFEPAGLASDVEGNLYVADRGNNRVLALCLYSLRRAAPARTPRAGRARLAGFCFALLAGATLAGCHNHASVNPNETPAGSYPVVITGTAQNAGRSITLTLNVT